MEKILKQPKIVTYENVELITDVLESAMETWEAQEMAIEILQRLHKPLGKKTIIKPFEDDKVAVNVNGRIFVNNKILEEK